MPGPLIILANLPTGKNPLSLLDDNFAYLLALIQAGESGFALTTNGTSGPATFNPVTKVLNIPDYTLTAAQIQSALAGLPTVLPGAPGQLWWNGGVLSLS